MSNSSTPGMNITDGVITTAYDKPYLKIKEYNDNTDAHNLEISCDTTNNNSNPNSNKPNCSTENTSFSQLQIPPFSGEG